MNNILISSDSPTAHYFVRQGIANVFRSCGYNPILWNCKHQSAFDAFDEADSILAFFGQTYNLTPSVVKAIEERPHMRVFLKASDWGPLSDSLDTNLYPVLIANQEEIELVKELRDKTGKPDSLHVHYNEKRLDQTHGHWRKEGFKVSSFMLAADPFIYSNGQVRPELVSDIAFIGGRWGYKAQTIDRWLLPLTHRKYDLNIKIFGNQDWGVPAYCGQAPTEINKDIFKSAKICANIHEPHSQVYGYDVIERPFKVAVNKSLVISDYVEDLAEIYGDTMVFCNTPKEFQDSCVEYSRNYEKYYREIREMEEEAYKITLAGQLYHHRVASLFQSVGDYYNSGLILENLNGYK
jgi:hypothetical protein